MLKRFLAGLVLALMALPAAQAANYAGISFCGGTVTPGDPTDRENQIGDMTLQAAVDQPASMTTCGKGYLLAKCGDHESANRIFDKCIAAGYVGAMIWKAFQLENGNGMARDLKAAADLLRRAAMSSDPGYGPLGRMHYATVLFEGRGVVRDPEEAMKWFRRAAAEGSEEAAEFLRSGYHTGVRDNRGMGAGTPTAAALAPLQAAQEVSGGTAAGGPVADAGTEQQIPSRAIALTARPGATLDVPRISPRSENSASSAVEGLQLSPAAASLVAQDNWAGGYVWLLLAAFLAGVLFQRPVQGIRVRAHQPHVAGA